MTLADTVSSLLRSAGVAPSQLVIEVTESGIMRDPSRALKSLTLLRDLGVTIAIDDFGTGYSSLAHLRHLPIDEIKIDQSFILDLLANEHDVFITEAVIDLGHKLGLKVVAEGVQDEALWHKLSGMGCDHAQGFYLSQPMPASQVHPWLLLPSRPGIAPQDVPWDTILQLQSQTGA
jgi:EAL domain-containing protein (putative c-di-GMP-specific phosphodiesterase class I)